MTELTINHFVYQLILNWGKNDVPAIALDWLDEQGVAIPQIQAGWGEHLRNLGRHQWRQSQVLAFLIDQPGFDLLELKTLAGYPAAAVLENLPALEYGEDDQVIDQQFEKVTLLTDGFFTIVPVDQTAAIAKEFYVSEGLEFYLSYLDDALSSYEVYLSLELQYLYYLIRGESPPHDFMPDVDEILKQLEPVPLDEIEIDNINNTRGLSDFVLAYLDAQLDMGAMGINGNEVVNDVNRLEPSAFQELVETAQNFETDWGELFIGQENQAAWDFLLTQNGHGSGFWGRPEYWDDRTTIEYNDQTGTVMQLLTEAARNEGTMELMRGPGGMVYVTH